MLLPLFLSNYTFPVTMNVDYIVNCAASMDNFYKNLDDIVKGRPHWMFEDVFNQSPILKGYIDTHVLERADGHEIYYILQGLLFLTVDIQKLHHLRPLP